MAFHQEIDTLIFCSFRYALGRSTYIVSEVVNLIIKYQNALAVNTIQLMQKEILAAFHDDAIGMECDEESWKRVLETFEVYK